MSSLASGSNRVVVDWDGTAVEIAWPAMGDWIPGAAEFMRQQLVAGRDVVVFTTRLAPTEVDEVTPRNPDDVEHEFRTIRRMLDENGLAAVAIWDKPWKPGGICYIDDKAIPLVRYSQPAIQGYEWDSIAREIDRRVNGC